ncbi:hypothetical protein [Niveispirillum cyanobacteriorum]|uniref:hypothetical protein n=1 Tax=Niveispirillum cyanobacteriorum TaxID=1612173 RepID=UPI0018F7EBFB|nr:hypothetical protein [Niveispirillum cyanobacteriorum]
MLFNRPLSRSKLMELLAGHPRCIVAMEACSTSHHWGGVAQGTGHAQTHQMPPDAFEG